MKLSIGIVGLPNVGKSTLFNALTKKSVPAENYPFCTIDPSVGIVPVPDERVSQLSQFSQSLKTIPAVIEFVDIAGLVKGASQGEGLGNKFLSHIREVDAILEIVRIFPIDAKNSAEIMHVYGTIDPLRDIKVINFELILADLETATKRLGSIQKDIKQSDKDALIEQKVLEKIIQSLEAEKMINTLSFDEKELQKVKQLNFLTFKSILYGLNTRANVENLNVTNKEMFKELTDYIESTHSAWILIDAKTEDELKDFVGEEKKEMRGMLGSSDDGINALIAKGYGLLQLETFFTTGEDETRAWTIAKGSTAPIAGTAIHTDFRDKFIRAEVVACNDLLSSGSYANARAKGYVRTEGKDYIVQDGDVIEFRI